MRSFVFDDKSRLLGVIEHLWARGREPGLNFHASPPCPLRSFMSEGGPLGETARYVRLAWGCMASSRGVSNDYRADILLVADEDVEHLAHVAGFRWFAEAYGVPITTVVERVG